MSQILLVACVIAAGGLGCGRKLTTVTLAPMTFVHESAPIEGTIELCLSPGLRMRQWDVRGHGFKIDLGGRTALNLEILARSAFSEVLVSFDRDCGSATDRPWLTARILAANRDLDSLWSTEQNTTITMEFELAQDDGRTIWSLITKGDVSTSPSAFTRRRVRAAEAFGEAIEITLQRAFEALIESEDVRGAFGAATIDAREELPPEPT